MIYGSVCSGIEAATVAWKPLGWEAAWFSEIEKFPCEVLAHHYPKTENLGDMTKLHEKELFNERSIDLLVGGTPCQSFSIAGLRKGLADPRGNLALHFLKILDLKRPKWMVWENVPGVLSSWSDEEGSFKTGYDDEREEARRGWQTNDFDTFIGGLKKLGYGIAWRILDAQYIGVPQRRRRVFVVGYLGDWRRAAAVLFESHSLSWYPPPSRETGEGFTADVAPSIRASGPGTERIGESRGQDPVVAVPEIANTLTKRMHKGINTTVDERQTPIVAIHPHIVGRGPEAGPQGKEYLADGSAYTMDARGEPQAVIHSLRGEGYDASEDGTGRGTPIVAFQHKASSTNSMNPSKVTPTLDKGKSDGIAIAFEPRHYTRGQGGAKGADQVGALSAEAYGSSDKAPHLLTNMSVRRLTPRECERLQGFPDNYTLIKRTTGKMAVDSPRYKAIGNSMAKDVMLWIAKRIEMVEAFKRLMGIK